MEYRTAKDMVSFYRIKLTADGNIKLGVQRPVSQEELVAIKAKKSEIITIIKKEEEIWTQRERESRNSLPKTVEGWMAEMERAERRKY